MFPNYSELTIDEVGLVLDPLIAFHGDGTLNLYEIECREKSAMAIQRALREGRIKSYTGISTDKEEASKVRKKGLSAFLIQEDREILRDLDTLRAMGNGVVLILSVSETSPERAEKYRIEAEEKRGLRVISYPPLRA